MVCRLSESFSPPFRDEAWIQNGLPVEQLYEFLIQVSNNNALLNEGIANLERFDDLAAIDAVIQNPLDGFTVMVNNQGIATFKESSGIWVKSADDTTVII